MDALDDLLAPARWESGRCQVEQALAEIDDDESRGKVAVAADNPKVQAAQVVAAFKHLIGDSPGDSTVRRHRSRHCSCS